MVGQFRTVEVWTSRGRESVVCMRSLRLRSLRSLWSRWHHCGHCGYCSQCRHCDRGNVTAVTAVKVTAVALTTVAVTAVAVTAVMLMVPRVEICVRLTYNARPRLLFAASVLTDRLARSLLRNVLTCHMVLLLVLFIEINPNITKL